MSKVKTGIGSAIGPEAKHKKTAQGHTKRSIKMSSMNKSKKRSFKHSRGQG